MENISACNFFGLSSQPWSLFSQLLRFNLKGQYASDGENKLQHRIKSGGLGKYEPKKFGRENTNYPLLIG